MQECASLIHSRVGRTVAGLGPLSACLLTGGQEASAGQGNSATHIHIPHDLGSSCDQVNHFPTPKKYLRNSEKPKQATTITGRDNLVAARLR